MLQRVWSVESVKSIEYVGCIECVECWDLGVLSVGRVTESSVNATVLAYFVHCLCCHESHDCVIHIHMHVYQYQ